MKYIGEPGMSIIDYDRLKAVFVFDKNGEYETDDPKIIEFMKRKKPHIKRVESERPTAEPKKSESELHKCKKCDFTCETKGEMMKHYKVSHPKEG